MATTLMPLDPAVSAQRVYRLLPISASLLPEEIIAGRRARRMRTWVIVIVLIVAGLCGFWIYDANRSVQAAEEDLDAATAEVVDLKREQDKFSTVVQVQGEIDLLKAQLKTTMANDLDWAAMLSTIRTTGEPMDIEVVTVNGKINTGEATGTSSAGTLPSTSSSGSVGAVAINGTAADKEAVAAYVDALGKQKTIANPYVTSVTTNEEGVVFSLTADITDLALCGRFTDTCQPTGGR